MTLTSPRSRQQLGDEAVSYVRDQITSGNLMPGAPVRPEAIAAELGISSTPAREALQALRAEGFLELAPRRGFTVARVTGEDIRDIYLVQSFVAGELASRAVERATPELLNRLEQVQDDLSRAAQSGDFGRLEEANHLFHREINLAADAPKLAWAIQMLSRYAPSRFYSSIEGWPQTTIEDHSVLLKAFRENDAPMARREMGEHVGRAGELLAVHIDARLQAIVNPN